MTIHSTEEHKRHKLSRREFLYLCMVGLNVVACGELVQLTENPTVTLPQDTPSPPSKTPASQTTIISTETPSSEPKIKVDEIYINTPTPNQNIQYPSIIIDGHQDIAWNALEFGRDPTKSAYQIREEEAGTGIPAVVGERITGLPEYRKGRIGIIFATIFVMPRHRAYNRWNKVTYSNPAQASTQAMQQIEYYKQLSEIINGPKLISKLSDLEDLVSQIQDETNPEKLNVGFILLMEGADPIQSPKELLTWYEAGIRIVGPAWRATRYAGGTGEPGPLTELGRTLLTEMSRLNIILDLSHMAEASYFEAVDIYSGPIIASHSNPRTYLPGDRGLSDEMILKLVEKDGVVGIMPYNQYLKPGWSQGQPRESVTLETVADAIDYVVQLIGNVNHVALGSDFDGGFGLNEIPYEMDSIADLGKIVSPLENRGYKKKDVEAIMNGNWLRILRKGLPII